MSTQVLTDVKLYAGQYDLSGDHNAATLNYESDPKDDTVFGNTTRSNQGGLKVVGFDGEGLWSGGAGNLDEVLFGQVSTADLLHTVAPVGTQGTVAFFFRALKGSYQFGGQVGDLLPFSASAMGSGGVPMIRGTLMELGQKSSTATGTAQNLGAVSADQKLYAGLHVFAASGTSPTLDVTINSDTLEAFTDTPEEQIAFAQVDENLGSEWATPVSGAITDTWWRAEWTIGGSVSPAFTFAVVLGIQ